MEEDGQQFTVTTGQFLILPPNRLHRGTKACRTETIFHWLHFYTTGSFSCSETPVRDSNVIQKSSQQFEKKPFHISLPQYGAILKELQPNMLDIMEQITQVRIDRKENSKRFSDNTIPQLKLQQLFFPLLTYLPWRIKCGNTIPRCSSRNLCLSERSLQRKPLPYRYSRTLLFPSIICDPPPEKTLSENTGADYPAAATEKSRPTAYRQ